MHWGLLRTLLQHRDMGYVQDPLGRDGRPQRPATLRHSLSRSGSMPAKGVAPRRGREGGLGGGSHSGGGEYDGEESDENRGHNLRCGCSPVQEDAVLGLEACPMHVLAAAPAYRDTLPCVLMSILSSCGLHWHSRSRHFGGWPVRDHRNVWPECSSGPNWLAACPGAG